MIGMLFCPDIDEANPGAMHCVDKRNAPSLSFRLLGALRHDFLFGAGPNTQLSNTHLRPSYDWMSPMNKPFERCGLGGPAGWLRPSSAANSRVSQRQGDFFLGIETLALTPIT